MLFPTPEFMFVFLPLVASIFFLISLFHNGRLQLIWLLLTSLSFYAYWSVPLAGLMLLSVGVNYAIARFISDKNNPGFWLAIGVLFNVLLLGYFKYTGFLVENLGPLFGQSDMVVDIILPLGISFYTIQQIGYLFDVRRGFQAEQDPIRYAAFVTFFPQLVAGPIVRAGKLLPQLHPQRLATATRRIIILSPLGLAWLSMGLFKKLVLADSIAPHVDRLYAAGAAGSIDVIEAWLAPFAYGVQLYFDFSGYSDMAIGLALIFGFRLPDNFNSPYLASSIQDFWRRWHMTLSFFLRDRLYISFGGNRHGVPRQIIALVATMTIGGLWHGAGWTFILWGLAHGLMLCMHLCWRLSGAPKLPAFLAWLLTLFGVMLAWVLFRAESMEAANNIYSAMFQFQDLPSALSNMLETTMRALFLTVALLAIALVVPEPKELLRGRWPGLQHLVGSRTLKFRTTIGWTILTCFAFAMAFWRMQNYSPFLYFQF